MSISTAREEIVAKAGTASAAAPESPPQELRERAAETFTNLRTRVETGLRGRLERPAAARRLDTESGEPQVGSYVAFDLYAFTPVQFLGPPPYAPHKVIAGDEFAVIYAVLFVNPTIDIPSGFAVQPTVQLGGRTYRVGLEQVNLTYVTDGPDDFRQDVFTSPAPAYTWLEFWFRAPVPGPKPLLMEANLSADIVDMAQPYAAFASTIIDADTGVTQENIPLRYLIYPK